jgi:hypothetical protein
MLLDPSTKEIERLIDGESRRSLDHADSLIVIPSTESINEEGTAHPGRDLNQKTRKIYAVRANTEPMLDVARGTYKENMEDIHTCQSKLMRIFEE